MAEKKYYWLKLKRDFFKRHDIRIVEEMPNGKDYILFYMKLLLESIDHCGQLRFSDSIPYNAQMLSVITNTNIDTVEKALKLFIELNMIEMFEDGTLLMKEVERNIGSESDSAHRVREHREKQKALQCNDEVTECNRCNEKCNTEIETDKEKENRVTVTATSAEEPPTKKPQAVGCPYEKIIELFNSICVSYPPVRSIEGSRKNAVTARWKSDPRISTFEEVFRIAEASKFLKGGGEKKWKANFDWMMKATNFSKILEHLYDDPKKPRNANSSFDIESLDEIAYRHYGKARETQ